MSDQYLTIATYTTTAEADFDKKKLEKYGIEAFVSQGAALLEPLQDNSNENARLNVATKDRDEALRILSNNNL